MMENGFANWIGSLIGQLPALIVYVAGIVIALRRRTDQPRAARRVLLAFALLLIDAVIFSGLNGWLANYATAQAMSLEGVSQLFTWLAVAHSVLQAAALWLLLRTVFPAADSPAPGWLRRLVGALVGLVVGVILGVVLGDPVATALGVSDFEGAKGYFIIFALIPLLALAGLIAGAVIGGLRRPVGTV